jgi:hypothetical protein
MADATAVATSAHDAVDTATNELDAAKEQLSKLRSADRKAADRLAKTKSAAVDQAIAAYTGDHLSELDSLLSASDINEAARRMQLIQGALDVTSRTLRDYRAARRDSSASVTRLVDHLNDLEDHVNAAKANAADADAKVKQAFVAMAAYQAGSVIAIDGFVFPSPARTRLSTRSARPD